jgi:hypothetical protein
MKSRQLANVLIKILGLSVCLYAIPSCVSGIIVALMQPHGSRSGFELMGLSYYAVGAVVQFAIGLVIISISQTIAGWMFKSDDE